MKQTPYDAIIASLYPGAELQTLMPLTGGVSADVHRMDLRLADGSALSLVLRAHGASHSGHSAELEYQLLQTLHRGGLAVPETLHFDASGGVFADPFLIMAFSEGSSAVPAGEEDAHIDTMADVLARIHGFPTAGLPELPARNDPLPEVFDYLPAGAEWAALGAHLRTLSDTACQGSPKLLHGDFWPGNLLWQQGAVTAILDWEDAALGDPLSDVACCRVELRYRFGKARMQRFTQAYARHRPVDARRLALWQVYVAAAAQHFMGQWGLEAAREAHMRHEALASIREAGAVLMGRTLR